MDNTATAPSKEWTGISTHGSHSFVGRVDTPHTERLRNSQTGLMIKMKLEAMSEEERSELMGKQITMFREKVKMCQLSYSADVAKTMMSKISSESNQIVNSIWRLKRYVQSSLPERESEPTVVYAQWYLSNLMYLKELKDNFDERVFIPLSTMYSIAREQSPTADGAVSDQEKSLTSLSIDTVRPATTDSILKYKNDVPEVKELYDFTDVDNAASRLAYIRQRWQHLLDDEQEINATLFSIGSASAVPEQSAASLVNILRLVPDILLKCSNAADLAGQWLKVSSAKALDPKTKLSKLERVRSVLKDKLTGLNDNLDSQEKQLESDSTDLDFLLEREERVNEIMSKRREIDKKIEDFVKRLQEAEDSLRDVIARPNRHIQSQKDIESEIRRLQREIRLCEYERDIVSEDLAVEMDIKPCIIRFTDQLQNSCERLEQEIYQNKSERQNLETALVPVAEDKRRTEVQLSRANTELNSPALNGSATIKL